MISERLLARSNDLRNAVKLDRDAILSLAESIEQLANDVANMERLVIPAAARRAADIGGNVVSIADWRAK
jgi:hypothetical protein